jgi:hypothetical protein
MSTPAVLREEPIRRVVAALRIHGTDERGREIAQRVTQANTAELAEALAARRKASSRAAGTCRSRGRSSASNKPAPTRERGVLHRSHWSLRAGRDRSAHSIQIAGRRVFLPGFELRKRVTAPARR